MLFLCMIYSMNINMTASAVLEIYLNMEDELILLVESFLKDELTQKELINNVVDLHEQLLEEAYDEWCSWMPF